MQNPYVRGYFLQVATDQDAGHPILGPGSVVHGSLLAEHGDVRRLAGRLPLHHWLVFFYCAHLLSQIILSGTRATIDFS